MTDGRFRIVRLAAAACLAVLAAAAPLSAGALLTREEALKLAYPGATVTAERVFLTDEQRKRASEAGAAVTSNLVARYIAKQDGRIVGRAYVDTHMVRTKKETLLISLDGSGQVKRVDTTAFLEPIEYQAPQPFLNQYNGRTLTEDLRLQRAIRPIAGATLTARAVTDAVRRVLAIDAVLK